MLRDSVACFRSHAVAIFEPSIETERVRGAKSRWTGLRNFSEKRTENGESFSKLTVSEFQQHVVADGRRHSMSIAGIPSTARL